MKSSRTTADDRPGDRGEAPHDVPDTVVSASGPDRFDLFAAAGHEAVCATSALSDALAENV